jgi:hypothetical protein
MRASKSEKNLPRRGYVVVEACDVEIGPQLCGIGKALATMEAFG